MKCKVCGENLYKEITFFDLFNPKFMIHYECKKRIQVAQEGVLIPLDFVDVFYYGIVNSKQLDDPHYLFQKYMGLLIVNVLQKHRGSIILFFDRTVTFDDLNLIGYLTNDTLVVLSLQKSNLYLLENMIDEKI